MLRKKKRLRDLWKGFKSLFCIVLGKIIILKMVIMMTIGNIFLRTLFILFILFILCKWMGNKQIAQMNMFDYIIGITIGSVAADISLDIEKNLLAGVLCLGLYCIIDRGISFINMRSNCFRRIFNGKSVILIDKGSIISSGLKRCKIDITELLSEARVNGYFDLREVNYAVMETSGKISFLAKEEKRPLSKGDYLDRIVGSGYCTCLVINGEVIEENLERCKRDRKWLYREAKMNGYREFGDILLMYMDENERVSIYGKSDKVEGVSE